MTWKGYSTLAAGVLLAAGFSSALVIAVWQQPDRGAAFIEVFKALISWPFVVGVLGFTFGVTFRREVATFIKNIGSIRFPGGEIRAQQPPTDEKGAKKLTLTPQQVETVENYIKTLQNEATGATQQQEEVLKTAAHWWCQYLSLFLVPTTKTILNWLAGQKVAPTPGSYHESWKSLIPDAAERKTILSVLLNYGLVEQETGVLRVTAPGLFFLKFLQGDRPATI